MNNYFSFLNIDIKLAIEYSSKCFFDLTDHEINKISLNCSN